jgi:hypothetical protein
MDIPYNNVLFFFLLFSFKSDGNLQVFNVTSNSRGSFSKSLANITDFLSRTQSHGSETSQGGEGVILSRGTSKTVGYGILYV